MSRILIAYWSGTGNTEKMAQLINEGAVGKGAEVVCKTAGQVSADEALGYDVIAIGSPSMGDEVLEESEVEPFVAELESKCKGKKIGIFGSYGWGDGQWMRDWAERMRKAEANLMDDGFMVHETPDGDDIQKCKDWGEALAAF